MHVALAFEHFHQRIERHIAPRRNQIRFAGGFSLVVIVPVPFYMLWLD